MSPDAATVPKGNPAGFNAGIIGGLQSGETVIAWEWDCDTSAAPEIDSMTLDPRGVCIYSDLGAFTVKVTARTSHGRTPSATTSIIVTTP